MKAPELLKEFDPLREFWPDGTIKKETYMIKMSYIVYRYNSNGEAIGINVNGTEYPPYSKIEFSEDGKKLRVIAQK